MHDYDTQTTLDDLSRSFQAYKETNEERLHSLEQKGDVDPLVQEKMDRIETSLDEAEKRLKRMEAQNFRPAVEISDGSDSAHQSAFMDYVRKGLDAPLLDIERKSLSTSPDRDGGYLVPSGLHDSLYATLQTTSVFRNLASVREISSSALEFLIDKDFGDAGWVSEKQDRPETNTPELIKSRIPVHEMYAKPRATQKLLDDASLNIEEWLSQKIAYKMALMENAAFIMGDGDNKPKGILSYETTTKANWEWNKLEAVKSGVNGAFEDGNEANTLLDLFSALKSQYLPGSTWLMSRMTQSALRKLKNPNNHEYLWQPPLSGAPSSTLMGYPIAIADDMPSLTKDQASKAIVFGNFKEGYQIVDRTGMRVLRDPYSAKPYVEFYTTRRVGGDVLNFEALKVLNFAA